MRGHDDQVVSPKLGCFNDRSRGVRIRNVQEFCRRADLLRHRARLIEHLARADLAGRVKAIDLVLRRNPSRVASAPLVDRQRSVTVMIVSLAFKAFARAMPCSTPSSRSVRAQENVGVHAVAPLLVEQSDAWVIWAGVRHGSMCVFGDGLAVTASKRQPR